MLAPFQKVFTVFYQRKAQYIEMNNSNNSRSEQGFCELNSVIGIEIEIPEFVRKNLQPLIYVRMTIELQSGKLMVEICQSIPKLLYKWRSLIRQPSCLMKTTCTSK